MTKNKWFFFVILLLGASVVGQAIYYFIGGDFYESSALRSFLVVLQLIFGFVVTFYGWKKFQILSRSKS